MTLKTLIVDDDEVITFIHENVVAESELSAQPMTAINGREALECISANLTNDTAYLVLLDINMPVMNGWQFLNALDETPFADQVYVIIVTSSVDRADHEKAKEFERVFGYIEKPITVDNCQRIKNIPALSELFLQK
ncbi:response regulator receiver protein [Fulvivirga imtechensis AK7]|uniref:Response regulator receiver protein n=1 Tax=Fulvivirga imtechensis AK7 TaxID=1237149 RepID=L8JUW9_9BACT|nr:response regulator [Fulvivirga imtechensis]ELR72781.1 response regulator receiver protein [Fulvivirga imtechensis AK7]